MVGERPARIAVWGMNGKKKKTKMEIKGEFLFPPQVS